jgi:hypothetical protein
MSLPVLAACTGVLVAAVATGVLAGRYVRRPRACYLAWTAATLSLTAAATAGLRPSAFHAGPPDAQMAGARSFQGGALVWSGGMRDLKSRE